MPVGRSVFRFGPFQFDPQSGDLADGQRRRTLRPRTSQVLAVLLRHPGELITHDEFRRALWDEDTHVDYEQALANAMWELRQALGDDAHTPRYVEVLPRRGHRFLVPVTSAAVSLPPLSAASSSAVSREGGARDRVAVIPFQDLSGTPAHAALGASLADEMISTLACLGSVCVVSRTSGARAGGAQRPLRDIARELDAAFVVEGTMTVDGQHVHVNAQLVRFPADTVMWARGYERERATPSSLPQQLGRRIARDVAVALANVQRADSASDAPFDAEMRRLYLRARVCMDHRSAGEMHTGLALFREYADRAPDDAHAWSGLAYAHVLAAWVGLAPRPILVSRAVEAARRALRLDPALEEAHAVVGLASAIGRFAWAEAEAHFARAFALEPDCIVAHEWRAWLRSWCGRHDDAVAHIREASRLDPLSDCTVGDLVRILLQARRFDEALETAAVARRVAPEQPYLSWCEAVALLAARRSDALAALEACRRLNPHQAVLGALGYAYGLAGRRDRAETILAELTARTRTEHVWTGMLSWPNIGLGRLDEAIACLERGWDERDLWAEQLLVDPLLDPLRGRPRFEALVQKVGFPQA